MVSSVYFWMIFLLFFKLLNMLFNDILDFVTENTLLVSSCKENSCATTIYLTGRVE